MDVEEQEQVLSSQDELSDDEVSDGGLEIVVESPHVKKRSSKSLEIKPEEKEVIESMEDEMEKALSEKAAKYNCTSLNVKHLIKNVITNEHVVAMVKQVEKAEAVTDIPFEPKLTRAKAKELSKTQIHPGISPKLPSEVQVLITEELNEDDEDDEYLPEEKEEESEDEKDTSATSELESSFQLSQDVEKPEPSFSEDGVFKLPPNVSEPDTNIALRTRSKLSLSHTPLEVIEQAFMPPDITTDMYDMDCGDNDWEEFLKTFTKPIDEVLKDDDDQDPEYNILADLAENEVDKEELRIDKAVKITRKEVKTLISELNDIEDWFPITVQESKQPPPPTQDENECITPTILQITEDNTWIQTPINEQIELKQDVQEIQEIQTSEEPLFTYEVVEPIAYEVFFIPDAMNDTQKLLLYQQFRQHTQMLAQHFLLGYCTQYKDVVEKCPTYLDDLVPLKDSMNIVNLDAAIQLVENWKNKIDNCDEDVEKMNEQYSEMCKEHKRVKKKGYGYIPKMPDLIVQTIANSEVFLYPQLLPISHFPDPSLALKTFQFVPGEANLLALGVDQFKEFLKQQLAEDETKDEIDREKEIPLNSICYYISRYMLPMHTPDYLYNRLKRLKQTKCDNAVKTYWLTNQLPTITHFLYNLEDFGCFPPKLRGPDMHLPLWKKLLYPDLIENTPQPKKPVEIIPKARVSSQFTSSKYTKKSSPAKNTNKKIFVPRRFPVFDTGKKLSDYFSIANDKEIVPRLTRKFSEMKFNSSIFANITCNEEKASTYLVRDSPDTTVKESEVLLSLPNVSSFRKSGSTDENNDCIELNEVSTTNADLEEEENVRKDSIEASSTIKNNGNKLRKEFISHITTSLSSEDPSVINEKVNSYMQAFYDKVKERLDVHQYQQFMQVLNNFDYQLSSTKDLYEQICKILLPKYKDIADEFLKFLTITEAKNIGKSSPHFVFRNMSLFLQKLGVYCKDQPLQLKEVYRSLTELASCVDASMDLVKATILPLLKGNALLIDWFSQIFPGEIDPESLISGSMDTVDVNIDPDETVVMPDSNQEEHMKQSDDNQTKQFSSPLRDSQKEDGDYDIDDDDEPSADSRIQTEEKTPRKRKLKISPDKEERPNKKIKTPSSKTNNKNESSSSLNKSQLNDKEEDKDEKTNIFVDKRLMCNEIFEEICKELEDDDVNENKQECNKSLHLNENNACSIEENKIEIESSSIHKNVVDDKNDNNKEKKVPQDEINENIEEIELDYEHTDADDETEGNYSDVDEDDAENEKDGDENDADEGNKQDIEESMVFELNSCDVTEEVETIQKAELVDNNEQVDTNDDSDDEDTLNSTKSSNPNCSKNTSNNSQNEDSLNLTKSSNSNHSDSSNTTDDSEDEDDFEDENSLNLTKSSHPNHSNTSNNSENEDSLNLTKSSNLNHSKNSNTSDDSEEKDENSLNLTKSSNPNNSEDNNTTDDSEDKDSITSTQSPNPNCSEKSNNIIIEEVTWTRDEDKMILLTIREMGSDNEAIIHISKQLKNKSIQQIQRRFNTLITLLQQMAASQDNDSD